MRRMWFCCVMVLVLVACQSSKNLTGSDLATVQRATQQAWSGGAYGSGYGTTYVIEVLPAQVKAKDTLHFDTVYTDGRAFVPEVSQQGSVYVLSFEYTSRPGRNEMGEIDERQQIEQPKKASLYPDFEGKALVVFRYKEERYTLVVKDFKRLEPLNYP